MLRKDEEPVQPADWDSRSPQKACNTQAEHNVQVREAQSHILADSNESYSPHRSMKSGVWTDQRVSALQLKTISTKTQYCCSKCVNLWIDEWQQAITGLIRATMSRCPSQQWSASTLFSSTKESKCNLSLIRACWLIYEDWAALCRNWPFEL